MSAPASVFSSPYGRHPTLEDAIKQTPRSKASPFTTKYYTPSPLQRNNNLIKSLSSALSSTPRSLKKPMIIHTPQSVTSQLAWHHHSTPQSQVKNPFEIALVNQLQNSLVSPGIFTISTPSSDEKVRDDLYIFENHCKTSKNLHCPLDILNKSNVASSQNVRVLEKKYFCFILHFTSYLSV